jgi:hypothetical protein
MKKNRILPILMTLIAVASGPFAVRASGPSDGKPEDVEREVRKAFDVWAGALTTGDKKTYLDGFWDSPKLVIRVASGEWRGLDAYRKRIEAAQLPPGNIADYKNIQVVALGADGAVVTYERPAPQAGPGDPVIIRGTVAFVRTSSGWKIAAWHAHSITQKTDH